jgi:hypothetical protein
LPLRTQKVLILIFLTALGGEFHPILSYLPSLPRSTSFERILTADGVSAQGFAHPHTIVLAFNPGELLKYLDMMSS